MIPEAKIIEIRDRASIVEVLSDHLTLRKVGRNYLGLCPFHSEKTPSFTVSEEKGIFHCFGCGAGGSVFHFLMQYDHLSFPEAVERVGKRYGIVVEQQRQPRDGREAEQRESLFRINEKVSAYFHENLFGRAGGKGALEYLKARGVDEKAARRFYLGYAPQGGQGLVEYLKREGISFKDAVRLGLLSDRGAERYGEKFFGRLMFPIAEPGGKIVGFGGRVIGEGLPKYLNSTETPLFRKGATLYGLFHAKEAIRQQDRVVVVEGYLDVIALWQFGVAYTAATLGTALTPDHVRILGRYTKNIIALFDGDEAGRKAAARSFEIFLEGGLLGRAAFLPKGEDPDTFIHSQGKDALEAIIDRAIPLADYYLTWLEERFGRSLEAKSQIAQEVKRVLAKVRNAFEADLLIRRAVDMLGIRESLLRAPMPGAGEAQRAPAGGTPPKEAPLTAREDMAERSLVCLMLRSPTIIQQVMQEGEFERLVSPAWCEMVGAILAEWKEYGEVEATRFSQRLSSERAAEIAGLMLEGEKIAEEDGERMAADCLSHLRRRQLRDLQRQLRQAIRRAEEVKDEKTKRERMLEWQEAVRRERQLLRQWHAAKTDLR